MSAELYYLGVDGGGTKTEFVCLTRDGTIVAQAVTGTTYHLQIGLDGAVARLGDGVAAICTQLRISPADFAFAFFGLPAFGEDSTVDPLLEAACGRILGHDRYACGNDMICGWAGSLGCADGINIVAGTGSIGYGERMGVAARAGGWGEVFGDEGSAYWIAIQGLNVFSRMSDGRLERGPLYVALRDELSISDDLSLCELVMGKSGMARDRIAGLAQIVSQAAERGDQKANDILVRAAEELVSLTLAIRSALEFAPEDEVAVSWSGGVFSGVTVVREQFVRRLLAEGDFRIAPPIYSPAIGAGLYAVKLSIAFPSCR